MNRQILACPVLLGRANQPDGRDGPPGRPLCLARPAVAPYRLRQAYTRTQIAASRTKSATLLARMFHTLLDSLRADCRCSPESRLLAGTSGLPAKPPPETSARRSGKILRLAWAGGGFSGVGGLTISLRKGGFALARIYRDYRHHKNCQQTNDRGDGEDCEICGLEANGVRHLLRNQRNTKKVLYLTKLSSLMGVEAVCPPVL